MAARTRNDVVMETAANNTVKEIHNCILEAMAYRGVDNSGLAELMDTTEVAIGQMLAHDTRNLSVKAVGRIFSALGYELGIWAYPPQDEKN